MRKFSVFALIAVSALALATSGFVSVFNSTYPSTKKATCATCHSSGKKLNAYGEDISKAADGKAVTSAVLKKVEGLDSDKDGVSNIDEINKGTPPGK